MAFGHWMEIVEGTVRLRLGPVRREDAKRYVASDAGHGLQSYEVMRYLGATSAPTEQAEEEWWDGASKKEEHLHWGIYVPDPHTTDGAPWKLVGTTTLHLQGFNRRVAESGFLLFDRAYWRQRVASTAHLGRTLYGFQELDLLAISSEAYAPNVGSNRALTGVGYVQTGMRYSNGVAGGQVMDSIQYLLPNPAEESWRYFWRRPDDDIPPEFHEGRTRAVETLERAQKAVTFL